MSVINRRFFAHSAISSVPVSAATAANPPAAERRRRGSCRDLEAAGIGLPFFGIAIQMTSPRYVSSLVARSPRLGNLNSSDVHPKTSGTARAEFRVIDHVFNSQMLVLTPQCGIPAAHDPSSGISGTPRPTPSPSPANRRAKARHPRTLNRRQANSNPLVTGTKFSVIRHEILLGSSVVTRHCNAEPYSGTLPVAAAHGLPCSEIRHKNLRERSRRSPFRDRVFLECADLSMKYHFCESTS